ncbi:MAG: DUF503 domain-containing protein [Dehalococcoidia bacterium]|nr:DUF503 domain-containing protein [Dehalococcoidia bacterium]
MNVGVCKINLRIPENQTLKGKRQVVQSIVNRVRGKFNVAIAEVENGDVWQIATLGISYVSNDGRHVNEVMSKIVDYIVKSRLDAEILDYEIELIPVF